MMPKPKQSKSNNNFKNEVSTVSSERILYESRPNMILYSDNFIFKIIVLFFLVFMFSPILALVYRIQGTLQSNYQVSFVNMTYIAEGILFLCILIIIVKLILDYLDWNNTLYTLTDKRIVIKRGLFNKEKISMPYSKVQDIDVSQSVLERLLNAGDIVIYGGRDNVETILDEVSNPRDVEEIILNQVNNLMYSYNQNQYGPAYNNDYRNDVVREDNVNNRNYQNRSEDYVNDKDFATINNPHINLDYNNKQHNRYEKSNPKSDRKYSHSFNENYDEYDSRSNQDYDYVDDEDFEEYNVESKKHSFKNNSNTHYFNTDDNLKRPSIKNNNFEKKNKNNKLDKEELLSLNKRKFKKS